MTIDTNRDGYVTRRFWIQGRRASQWANLESFDDGQLAIGRLGSLVEGGDYDELRLVQAEISPITGACDYSHIVTVRDGDVLMPQMDPIAGTLSADGVEEPPIAEIGPQLPLWDADPNIQEHHQHTLPLEAQETIPPSMPPVPGESHAAWQREDGNWDVGGWTISDEAHTAIESEQDRGAEQPDHSLSATASDAAIFGRRKRTQATRSQQSARTTRSVRGTNKATRRAPSGTRIALMSGVFAGAIAIGLAIAAVAPERAANLYAAALRDVTQMLPKVTLEEAITRGNLKALHHHLTNGANPDTHLKDGTPLLLQAARYGHTQAVSLLMQAGANPALPLEGGETILHQTAREGLSHALSTMLDAGQTPVDLAAGLDRCITPLSAAVEAGMTRAVSVLTKRGASLTAQPDCAIGPMVLAAEQPHILARLESMQAKREGLIRLATGPRPPAREPDAPAAVSAPDSTNAKNQALTEHLKTDRAGQPIIVAAVDPTDQTSPLPHLPERMEQHDLLNEASAAANEGKQQNTTTTVKDETAAPTAETHRVNNPDEKTDNPALAAVDTTETHPPAQSKAKTKSLKQPPSAAKPLAPKPLARIKPEPPPVTAQIVADKPGTIRPPRNADQIATAMATAIDEGDQSKVNHLMADLSTGALSAMTVVTDDRYGSGERSLLDYAILRGRRAIADDLIRVGLRPGASTLHAAIANAERPELSGTVAWLIDRGANLNAQADGLTPLMRAALRGRQDLVEQLLSAGADPGLATADGRTAADFARRAGRPALQESLLLAAQEGRYRNLMLGLSWTDNIDSLGSQIEQCKDIGDDFTACKLRAPSWLDDAAVIVGQFDRRAEGRLVALQIDSVPLKNAEQARQRFEEVALAIEDRLPRGHSGFTNRRAPEGVGFFHALRPEVNEGSYFGYWPDHDRARPVFVHLKLSGLDDQRGFYRVVIGNPFRAS